jgi:hypothetical protein
MYIDSKWIMKPESLGVITTSIELNDWTNTYQTSIRKAHKLAKYSNSQLRHQAWTLDGQIVVVCVTVYNTKGNIVAFATPWPPGDDEFCAATDTGAGFSVVSPTGVEAWEAKVSFRKVVGSGCPVTGRATGVMSEASDGEEGASVAILSVTVSVVFCEPVAIVATPGCSNEEVDTPPSLSSDDDAELLASELEVEVRVEVIERDEGGPCWEEAGSVVDVVVESALGNGSNAKQDANAPAAVASSRLWFRVQSSAASACAWPCPAPAEADGASFGGDNDVSDVLLVVEEGMTEAIFTTVFSMRTVVFFAAALCTKAVWRRLVWASKVLKKYGVEISVVARLETVEPNEFVEVTWSCIPTEVSVAPRVSVMRMLVVLVVERSMTTCAWVELAALISSAVEAFVEVNICGVGVVSTVSCKEAHNMVSMASRWPLRPIMMKKAFRVPNSASFPHCTWKLRWVMMEGRLACWGIWYM